MQPPLHRRIFLRKLAPTTGATVLSRNRRDILLWRHQQLVDHLAYSSLDQVRRSVAQKRVGSSVPRMLRYACYLAKLAEVTALIQRLRIDLNERRLSPTGRFQVLPVYSDHCELILSMHRARDFIITAQNPWPGSPERRSDIYKGGVVTSRNHFD